MSNNIMSNNMIKNIYKIFSDLLFNIFKLDIFYCNIDNFGDQLNKIIFKRLLNIPTSYNENVQEAEILGIGSILDFLLAEKNQNYYNNIPIRVFSTGFHYDIGENYWFKNLAIPDKLNRNIKIYALRGKLTQKRCAQFTDVSNIALGDGGLLCSELIDKNKIVPQYDLGIVSHISESDNPIFEKIHKEIKNSIIINIKQEPMDFLKQIAECKAVISTAMHPLIVCDSLEIPNMWVTLNDTNPLIPAYKFQDYYSVFDLEKTPYNLQKNGFNEETIKLVYLQYNIPKDKLENIKRDLIKSLNRLKEDLYKEAFKICFSNYFNKIRKAKNIFSISNEYHSNKKFKKFTIFGIKIKFKRKHES